jgi:outer membrane translocation and assembly module TamA
VLRKVYKNLYIGAEFDYQNLSRVEFIPTASHPIHLPAGHTGYANLEIGMGLVYDNRHNVLNVRHGIYSEVAFLHSDKSWGSDFNMSTVFVDQRAYFPIKKRNVLALQAMGQFNSGEVPFNQLALMGGEMMMRGYYLGRYRDKNLIAAQAEFRMLPLPFRFTKRWGAAAFISAGTVFNAWNNLQFNHLVVAGGGGVRFLLFPKKDIYTRADVAFTREGPGFYIFVGESF